MDDETKATIFDELMQMSGVVVQQKRHFLAREFAESQGVSYETGTRILERLRASGDVDRERILASSGRQAWGYFKS